MRRAVQLTLRAAKSTAPKPKAPQPPRPPMSHDAARRARARAAAANGAPRRQPRPADGAHREPPRQASAPAPRRPPADGAARRQPGPGKAPPQGKAPPRQRGAQADARPRQGQANGTTAPRKPRPKPRPAPTPAAAVDPRVDEDARRRRNQRETRRFPDAATCETQPKVAQKATLKLNSKGLTTAGKVAGALGVGVDVVRQAGSLAPNERRRRRRPRRRHCRVSGHGDRPDAGGRAGRQSCTSREGLGRGGRWAEARQGPSLERGRPEAFEAAAAPYPSGDEWSALQDRRPSLY